MHELIRFDDSNSYKHPVASYIKAKNNFPENRKRGISIFYLHSFNNSLQIKKHLTANNDC